MPSWNEIDAVGLRDLKGAMHWASRAAASSTFAERDAPVQGAPAKAAAIPRAAAAPQPAEAALQARIAELEATVQRLQAEVARLKAAARR